MHSIDPLKLKALHTFDDDNSNKGGDRENIRKTEGFHVYQQVVILA